jgi:hypothetical protein
MDIKLKLMRVAVQAIAMCFVLGLSVTNARASSAAVLSAGCIDCPQGGCVCYHFSGEDVGMMCSDGDPECESCCLAPGHFCSGQTAFLNNHTYSSGECGF